MRRAWCLALAASGSALVLWSCYSPTLSSPGFYCHVNDSPQCPDGQKCMGGRCVDNKAGLQFDGGANNMGTDLATNFSDLSVGGCTVISNWNGVSLGAL